MRSILLIGFLLLVPWPVVAAESPDQNGIPQEIALEEDGGTFVVPVRINGAITLKFVIDSGASVVQIPFDVFSTLQRANTISKNDVLGLDKYTVADGTSHEQLKFVIRELQIGNTVIHNIPGTVSPPASPLLLGQTLLTRLNSWSLDNREHVFKFTAAEGSEISSPLPNSEETASYQKGVSDWNILHKWFNNLTGFRLTGADYWATQRHVPNHMSCSDAASTAANDQISILEFRSGCDDTKSLLDPMDERRADSAYKKGFNDEAAILPLSVARSSDTARSTSLCGRSVSYEVSGSRTEFSGVWSGTWNIAGRLCGALIVQKVATGGEADLIYVYGPSHPGSGVAWKQQHCAGYLQDGALSFHDDQGSVFRFSRSGMDRLSATFVSRSGNLTGLFARLP